MKSKLLCTRLIQVMLAGGVACCAGVQWTSCSRLGQAQYASPGPVFIEEVDNQTHDFGSLSTPLYLAVKKRLTRVGIDVVSDKRAAYSLILRIMEPVLFPRSVPQATLLLETSFYDADGKRVDGPEYYELVSAKSDFESNRSENPTATIKKQNAQGGMGPGKPVYGAIMAFHEDSDRQSADLEAVRRDFADLIAKLIVQRYFKVDREAQPAAPAQQETTDDNQRSPVAADVSAPPAPAAPPSPPPAPSAAPAPPPEPRAPVALPNPPVAPLEPRAAVEPASGTESEIQPEAGEQADESADPPE